MSNITIPVPDSNTLKSITFGNGLYDKSNLQTYYRVMNYALRHNVTDLLGKQNERVRSELRSASRDKVYLEGFNDWLNKNFVKNPSWLKRAWRVDPEYRLKKPSNQGSYIEFDASELQSGGPFIDAYQVKGDDIVYGYKKHSLKTELSSTGKDGLKGSLVKLSNGKWRVYLNKASASKGSAGNVASTTSKASNTSITSSTGSNPSVSNTSNTSSTSSTSPTTTTDSTTSTGSITSTDTNTDSTTRSFDFLDDVLGTQKEASKDKTTELDPNQIANTIVSETKLNDTAISSLVSTYLNSLHRINRSYNTQTK